MRGKAGIAAEKIDSRRKPTRPRSRRTSRHDYHRRSSSLRSRRRKWAGKAAGARTSSVSFGSSFACPPWSGAAGDPSRTIRGSHVSYSYELGQGA